MNDAALALLGVLAGGAVSLAGSILEAADLIERRRVEAERERDRSPVQPVDVDREKRAFLAAMSDVERRLERRMR